MQENTQLYNLLPAHSVHVSRTLVLPLETEEEEQEEEEAEGRGEVVSACTGWVTRGEY